MAGHSCVRTGLAKAKPRAASSGKGTGWQGIAEQRRGVAVYSWDWRRHRLVTNAQQGQGIVEMSATKQRKGDVSHRPAWQRQSDGKHTESTQKGVRSCQ